MAYKLPPVNSGMFSDTTEQKSTDAAIALPILCNTNEYNKGLGHDVTGVTVGLSNASPCVMTYTATVAFPALANGDCVVLAGTLPSGLVAGTQYYVINHSAGQCNLAAKPGGTAINTSDAGSGSFTATCTHRFYLPTTGDYLVVWSIIGYSTTAGDQLEVWARLAGSDIVRSNTICDIARNAAQTVFSCSFIIPCTTAGQKFELYWRTSNTRATLLTSAAGTSPTRPVTPSVVMTINKVSK